MIYNFKFLAPFYQVCCHDTTSWFCAVFFAFTNVSHPFSGSKYDLYCLDLMAISWKLSIFSKSVDMIPSRFCFLLFVASKLASTPLLPSRLTDGTIWVRFSDIWWAKLIHASRSWKCWLVDVVEFLLKVSKYFDTWDCGQWSDWWAKLIHTSIQWSHRDPWFWAQRTM